MAMADATNLGGTRQVTAPSNANVDPGANFLGVSCFSAGSCVAVGDYADAGGSFVQPMDAIETTGTWGKAARVKPPPNANRGSPEATLFGVSCPSANACVAVGRYKDNAGDLRAMVATQVGGAFRRATEVSLPVNADSTDQDASLFGVSCLSTRNCVAVGAYTDSAGHTQAMTVAQAGSAFGRATEVPAPVNADPSQPTASFLGVSCYSVVSCVAVGSYVDEAGHRQAMVATQTAGVFGQGLELSAPAGAAGSPLAELSGVSCPSVGSCIAAGFYDDRVGHRQAMVATQVGGAFGQAVEVSAPGNANPANPLGTFQGVSCPPAGNCVAVGTFQDSVGYLQEMATGSGHSILPPPSPTGDRYWLVASDGGIFTFGKAGFVGSAGAIHLTEPAVGMASTPDGGGYWFVTSDGQVFSFGDARFFGSASPARLKGPVVGMAATPDGGGYWLVASDGRVFRFGDARSFGSAGAPDVNHPLVGMASTPDGRGYWLVASDGGVFAFGDARFLGSAAAVDSIQPVVGMAATPDGRGYWLVASDGRVFSFGDARTFGSVGAVDLAHPVVGMAATPDGRGYWLVASNGLVFPFGDARSFGSAASIRLNRPVVGMSGISRHGRARRGALGS